MDGTPTTQQPTCTRCSSQPWRSDWDFLKEFFRREQSLQQEMQTLVSQHTYDYQTLHGQLTALQLTHYSTSAHLQQAEQQRDTLHTENCSLRSEIDELNTRYNHLFGRQAREEREHSFVQEQYRELYQTSRAQESVLAQQSAALEKQAAEMDAAHTTASKLGEMMNSLLSASDLASEAFGATIEIADVIMRNKYQELTIEKLQHKIECFTRQADSDAVSCGCCPTPTLDWSSNVGTPLSTGIVLEDRVVHVEGEAVSVTSQNEIKGEDRDHVRGASRGGSDHGGEDKEAASAYKRWSFYREQHPLRPDDCEP